ncbi:phosphate butyryltransferase [Rhodovulum sp. ES.010]|uniref:phosphate acyltransferase n=1 Tax=Rhodovulum sp. ES.010 TaxID=1882821 RepID=UPI000928E1A7|nr:phosphate acyltransferase [Rhodovulum sp. ES.010]SIO50833.1 phosphate butyryltransferase [Rhodovulum sp. ES.010]
MGVRSFDELRERALTRAPLRLVVAGGEGPEIAAAVIAALENGLADRVLVAGDPSKMTPLYPDPLTSAVTFLSALDAADCASHAIAAIHENLGDVLMKGHVDSTSYLRAIMNRDHGLRSGSTLSNVTVAEMPSLNRLIAATDNGIVPSPDLAQKRRIILNTLPLFRGLGIAPVQVAAVCATEKVSDALPATRDAEALARESNDGGLPGFEVGGPMGYDVAVSAQAARIKELGGVPAAGRADLLLFPTIDAANSVAKAWKFQGQARTGSIVLGAKVPVLLNSRSDSVERRIDALLLAAAVLDGGQA